MLPTPSYIFFAGNTCLYMRLLKGDDVLFRTTNEDIRLEELIQKTYDELSVETPDEERYATMLTVIERLEKLRREKAKPAKTREVDIDPNKILMVAGNLIGILAILKYEEVNVIGTKALGLVMKLK